MIFEQINLPAAPSPNNLGNVKSVLWSKYFKALLILL
jgi:hypothetical protein